jgi:hypothetical protein
VTVKVPCSNETSQHFGHSRGSIRGNGLLARARAFLASKH